ncbi:unnamed protein product [Diplocarpon coronariae]|uniref:Fungal N-terminal domain-containing protein n=1 Tax=Diplocarpon coronariae TaxID=2795749 RepID=A0A218Z2Z7_9HELO|nr:hypothetical protein B2J93_3195 [Marssonina coronariae]
MAELNTPTSISAFLTLALRLAADASDFATTAGTTSAECRQLGLEISLFCSTLKQVQSKIGEAGKSRYSTCASRQTQHIVDHCWDVLMSIDALFARPRSSAGLKDDAMHKAILTLSHPGTHMLRKALEACLITLHILLHSMEFAGCLTSKRLSVVELATEEKAIAMIINSLKVSRNLAIESLESFEDERMDCRPSMGVEATQRRSNLRPGNKLRKTRRGTRLQDIAEKPEISAPGPKGKISAWVKDLVVDEGKYSLISLEFQQCSWSPTLAMTLDPVDVRTPYPSMPELGTGEAVSGRTISSPVVARDMVPAEVGTTSQQTNTTSHHHPLFISLPAEVDGDELYLDTEPAEQRLVRAATERPLQTLSTSKEKTRDRRPLLFSGETEGDR